MQADSSSISIGSKVIMPTTSSSSRRVIPRTPLVSRPVARTLASLKRMAMPEAVASTMSLLPLVMRTEISRSPSRMFMAMIPVERTRL